MSEKIIALVAAFLIGIGIEIALARRAAKRAAKKEGWDE